MNNNELEGDYMCKGIIYAKDAYEFKGENYWNENTLPRDPEHTNIDEIYILRLLCFLGLTVRYTDDPPREIEDRLDKELDLIESLGLERLHLLYYDIARYARQSGIELRVRGSAVGSLVCYCLGITDIEPLQFGLVPERYMNALRPSRPFFEFCIDAEGKKQIVDYLRTKYGEDHVAFVSAYDVVEPESDKPCLQRSRHAAAIVLTARSSGEYAEVDRFKGEPCFIYDLKDIERMGLHSLNFITFPPALSGIKELKQIEADAGNTVLFTDRSYEDPRVFELIAKGDTAGVAFFSREALREFAQTIKPESIEDLAAALALTYPSRFDLIPDYITAKRSFIKGETDMPFGDVLNCTCGIIIYHEQIINVLSELIGCSREYADVLRKSMWRDRENMDLSKEWERFRKEHKDEDPLKSYAGCEKCGFDEGAFKRFYSEIHKMAFDTVLKAFFITEAVLAYETAWYKVYYPDAFEKAFIQGKSNYIEGWE